MIIGLIMLNPCWITLPPVRSVEHTVRGYRLLTHSAACGSTASVAIIAVVTVLAGSPMFDCPCI